MIPHFSASTGMDNLSGKGFPRLITVMCQGQKGRFTTVLDNPSIWKLITRLNVLVMNEELDENKFVLRHGDIPSDHWALATPRMVENIKACAKGGF